MVAAFLLALLPPFPSLQTEGLVALEKECVAGFLGSGMGVFQFCLGVSSVVFRQLLELFKILLPRGALHECLVRQLCRSSWCGRFDLRAFLVS